MTVVPYDPKWKQEFIDMNKAWIQDMFVLEPMDEKELGNIEPYLERGGQIFYALDEDGTPMSCCLVAPRDDGDWEIMKFATKPEYAGRGVGSAVLNACVEYARAKGVPKLLIVSNTKCESAVHLYRKLGFTEIPVDKEQFPFDRANIAFEKYFDESAVGRLREFNRFYLPFMDLLGNRYLGSEYSIPEARVLYEVYEHKGCTAADVGKALHMDKSYLSRILKKHEQNGYVTRSVSEEDGRAFQLSLTTAGLRKVEEYVDLANADMVTRLSNLSAEDETRLKAALDTVTEILMKEIV